jgi:hypothetical protein
MTVRKHIPSIHGRELRELVLAAIPPLADVVGHEGQANPHLVMRALYNYASLAIRNGDIPDVIRCFRLTKKLVEIADDCDIFVQSAIWASFIHCFRENDPLALKVFQCIEPQVRETLYSPFTFPHTWLRDARIILPGDDRRRTWLTVDRRVEAEARLIRQVTCCGHFAVVRLQLEPNLDDRTVSLHNRLDDSDDAPLMYLEAVIEGVRSSLAKRSMEDCGVSYLRVDLLGLRHHPADSRKADFVAAAEEAMEQCISEAGLTRI